jgi:hypothetical protein
MKLLFAAICMLMIAVTAANLQAAENPVSDQPEYTGAQIRRMAREAHTVEQYTVLADYYATRQRMYKRKAAEEMHLWAERNAVINSVYEKWPRPVDSAKALYDYYEYKVGESAKLEAKYSRLADELAAK